VNPDGSLVFLTSNRVTVGGLAAGATAAQSATVRLPDGAAGVGTIRFLVTTDSDQAVPEYDANGLAAYGNNTSAPLDATATLAPYPDLTVTNVSVTPAGLQSGGIATVHWEDTNVGPGTVTTVFTDTVFVYRVNPDNTTTLLNATTQFGSVGPQSYS